MKSWIKQQSSPAYWLATANVHKEAIHQRVSMENSIPLFDGKAYEAVMPLTPWLIPAPSLNELTEDTLNKGMIITSASSFNQVVAHLRSLLVAGFMGDEVLFRFYDPQVVMPMLSLMSDAERHAFLGNLLSWSWWNGEKVVNYTNHPAKTYSLHTTPWWVIKDEHLNEPDNPSVLASHIARRLWEKIPQVINSFPQPEQLISDALEQARKEELDNCDAQLTVLARIIEQSESHTDSVAQAMLLSVDEKKKLHTLIKESA